MNSYLLLVILMVLSAGFAYINYRFIKMPFVIGLFFLSTVLSLAVISSKYWDVQHYGEIRQVIEHTDLSRIILEIMLGFLLFAGSLHTRWSSIREQIRPVTLFAILGVMLSTVIIAALLYYISGLFQIRINFLHCLIFGALISPTDPIAVLGILTKAKVAKKIESVIVGESLFNDGIGVVVFITLLDTLKSGKDNIDFAHFGGLFLQEAVGGLLFGLLLGYILHKLMRTIDNYETEVLLTIAFVMGGYATCSHFHLSGALAMVIMGLFVGNYKMEAAMSDHTRSYVHKFWQLVDVILNAILFISIAFVLVVIEFKKAYFFIGLIMIPMVMMARVIVVYLPSFMFRKFTNLRLNEARLIVWGGLRGGLSLALVLSLPPSGPRELLLIITYMVVVFSILVQGLTIERAARWLSPQEPETAPDSGENATPGES